MDTEHHISELRAALRAIPDLEARIRAIDATALSVRATMAELRRETVREMLTMMSHSEAAERLGISRARVGQLAAVPNEQAS